MGKASRYIQIAFPLPNEYLDATCIQLLRTAYEIFKHDDVLSDLVSHFRRQRRRGQDAHRLTLPAARAGIDLVVERRQGGCDRRVHQGRRGIEGRVGAAAGLGRAHGTAGGAGRCAGAGRLGSAARQRDDEAARGAGTAAVGFDRRPRPRPLGGRAAVRLTARHRHPGASGRPDAASSASTSWPRRCWAAPAAAPATRRRRSLV